MRELFDRLLPVFLENGGELFAYYDMTYQEINMVIDAARKREEQKYKMQVVLAHATAHWNAYAFNDPSKMPLPEESFPALFAAEIKEKEEARRHWTTMRDNLLGYASSHNEKHSKS